MKEVKDMNSEELVNYFVEKKIAGWSFREIAEILDNNKINSDNRKLIISKLEEVDKRQKEVLNKLEKSDKKKRGIINLLIGIVIIILGFILYENSTTVGVVFIFNFIIWGFGGLLILQGLANIITGFIKD